ncbi:gamma-glutamyltransferase family protein [Paraburkholderia sp. ZP32-5]|uniref:gamma-glutamyltransferase family protein n=1 Tax=Paraburkholderia sp. ZP32-5 TaxID=2883245 RepID=UPI001F276741|nr:gamma-glutamyltransferase [Paraburkholderia sp. ZP32-5]
MSFTTRPELRGTFGAISSTHWIATAVGMAVLERGGNAFDAAAACGFALQIVEPHLNGPGGEVPIIFQRAGDAEPTVICGQGVSPALATIDAFRAQGLEMVPGTGLLPAVVPGAFDAWMLMLRDHGTMPLEDILGYAIGYAENGYPLLSRAVASIVPVEQMFREDWPTSAAVWLPGGNVPKPGALFRNPGIAATYKRIIEEAKAASSDRAEQIEAARKVFYQGFVAEAIDRFYRTESLVDTSGEVHGGLLRGDDMASWQASYEPTVSLEYGGVRVHKTGPWGQGPVMLQQLALLSHFDLAAMDPLGDEFVHTVTECAKLAMADREAFYGDPATSEVPLELLLSAEYNARRVKLIDDRASMTVTASHLAGASERLAMICRRAGSETPHGAGGGEVTFAPIPAVEGDTVHLDVADRFGNVVSATPSGGWLQSSPVIPELGFPITTRGQMFWLDEGLPSSLRPRTRPRTTLTPTLMTRDGAAWLAIGTPGGDQQDQWPLSVFLRHLWHGYGLQRSIDAPMFHNRHCPTSFYPRDYEPGRLLIEGRFEPRVIERLRERGHKVSVMDDWSLGRVCAVQRSEGMLRAAATPRHMQSYALAR